MWQRYLTPRSLDEALGALATHGPRARIVAGATDLILELERGQRPGVDILIDITRLPGLDRIELEGDGRLRLGCLVTHNDAAASSLIQDRAFALARACWEVGAPQIRNRGTIAGNVITASPANDSIPPLAALDAVVTLRSSGGTRQVPLAGFHTGVRKTVMRPDEMLTSISFEAPPEGTRSTFVKIALRRAQAVSVVNAAVVVALEAGRVRGARIALGSVAPTILRAHEAEDFLAGKVLSEEACARAGEIAAGEARPIDDLRGSASFRREMVRVAVLRGLRAVRDGTEREGYPRSPIVLARPQRTTASGGFDHDDRRPIETTINGVATTFERGQDLTLLRLLRDEGHLTGTKEGCAEGECGACTVFLDGKAVMACMVPAPRAHRAEILTVEGLAEGGRLHPIQQAFLDEGAVQCGYCTPGFLMAGAMLLEEVERPDGWQMRQAITGNLCRCTGYYKILSAIEQAAASG
jgi:xanthine dehydrogenase iron-sulfur cluster and FAD-binding subunit A